MHATVSVRSKVNLLQSVSPSTTWVGEIELRLSDLADHWVISPAPICLRLTFESVDSK